MTYGCLLGKLMMYVISLDPTCSIGCADGTVHNLNQYIEISSVEVLQNVEAGSVEAVFSQNFGVVVSESKLEEFFSQIP